MKPFVRQISPLLYEFMWDVEITDALLQQQLDFRERIKEEFSSWITELRLGFKTLAIVLATPLDPNQITTWVNSMPTEHFFRPLPEKIWKIPVCYSPTTGRDLESLARHKSISQEELISLHSEQLYRIHLFGFLPGFMYLNGLVEQLHTPRKSNPDLIVPAGSVAIGGSQTGIYPSPSPGGWHLIGRTPLSIFDPGQRIPVFASIGERIEFTPITEREFDRMKMQANLPSAR